MQVLIAESSSSATSIRKVSAMSKQNNWPQRHISKIKNTLKYTLKDLKEQTKDQLLLLTFSCIDDMSCDKKEDKKKCNCAGHHEK